MSRNKKRKEIQTSAENDDLEYIPYFEDNDSLFNEEDREYDYLIKNIAKNGIGYSNLY